MEQKKIYAVLVYEMRNASTEQLNAEISITKIYRV